MNQWEWIAVLSLLFSVCACLFAVLAWANAKDLISTGFKSYVDLIAKRLSEIEKQLDDLKRDASAPPEERSRALMVERIQLFFKLLDEWRRKLSVSVNSDPGISEASQELLDLKRTAEGPEEYFPAQMEERFNYCTKILMTMVLRKKQQTSGGSESLKRLIKELATSAGLELIAPQKGDPFDRTQHLAAPRSGSLKTQAIVSEVIFDGLKRGDIIVELAVVET